MHVFKGFLSLCRYLNYIPIDLNLKFLWLKVEINVR